MSNGRDTIPRVPSGTETKMPARSAGRSRKMEIRSLIRSSVSNGVDWADVAALVSALGTAANACWIVLCAWPAAVPVARLAAAAWLAEPAGLVLCWGGLNGVSDVAEADEAA